MNQYLSFYIVLIAALFFIPGCKSSGYIWIEAIPDSDLISSRRYYISGPQQIKYNNTRQYERKTTRLVRQIGRRNCYYLIKCSARFDSIAQVQADTTRIIEELKAKGNLVNSIDFNGPIKGRVKQHCGPCAMAKKSKKTKPS